MKQLLFIITVVFMLMGCTKRTDNHMKFMDISMGLNIDKFNSELKKQGFNQVAKEHVTTIFEGKFNEDNVQIAVFENTKDKNVAMVAVEFLTLNSRSEVERISDKYGKELDEKFKGYFANKNSMFFKHLIEIPKPTKSVNRIGDYSVCFYSWQPPSGEIVLRIYNTSQLNLIYADKVNYESMQNINRN